MGFLDDIFKGDEMDAPVPLMSREQLKGQKGLINQSLPIAQDYLGKLGRSQGFEGLTGYEEMGLDTLGRYLESPSPTDSSLYGGAASELERTFGNEYDPVAGEYYQAYRTAVLRELEESKDRLAAETSARDKYFGGGRIQATGELEEDATNNLAMVLGQLFENERSRKLQAVPMAQNLMTAGENADINRITASQTLGSLPYNRSMQDYLRQMSELGIGLETALSLITNKNEYYQPGYEPSFFQSVYLPMVDAGAQVAGAYAGGA